MQLADDKHITTGLKDKGDRIVFVFLIIMQGYPDMDKFLFVRIFSINHFASILDVEGEYE